MSLLLSDSDHFFNIHSHVYVVTVMLITVDDFVIHHHHHHHVYTGCFVSHNFSRDSHKNSGISYLASPSSTADTLRCIFCKQIFVQNLQKSPGSLIHLTKRSASKLVRVCDNVKVIIEVKNVKVRIFRCSVTDGSFYSRTSIIRTSIIRISRLCSQMQGFFAFREQRQRSRLSKGGGH